MPNPTPSAAPVTETSAEKFRRVVAGIAAQLDDAFPAAVISPAGGGIEDGSAFYGADEMRPDFVARDDAAWKG